MRVREKRNARAAARAFTPAWGGLLQRGCACGGSSGGAEECEECGRERPASGLSRPPGHNFSRVRVRAAAREEEPSGGAGALRRELTVHGGRPLQRSEEEEPFDATDTASFADEQASTPEAEDSSAMAEEPSDGGGNIGQGTTNCPVTALFLSTVVGKAKSNCRVPSGQFGTSTLAKFKLTGLPPGSGTPTVGEQFKSLDDPFGVFGKLKTVSFTPGSDGIFDDCYILASANPLPANFTLKVEQNHLLNGQIISKNIITYTPDRVTIRPCKRVRGSCAFATVCRL